MDTDGVVSAGMQDDDVTRLVALTERKHELWDQLGNCDDEELRTRLFDELAANRSEIARLKSIVSVLLEEPSGTAPTHDQVPHSRRSVGETLRANLLLPEEKPVTVTPIAAAPPPGDTADADGPRQERRESWRNPVPAEQTETAATVVAERTPGPAETTDRSTRFGTPTDRDEGRRQTGATRDLDRVRRNRNSSIPGFAIIAVIGVLLVAAWFLFLRPGGSSDSSGLAGSENVGTESTMVGQIRAVLVGLGYESVLVEVRDGTVYLAGVVASDEDRVAAVAASQALAGEMPLDTTGFAVRSEDGEGGAPATTVSPSGVGENGDESVVVTAIAGPYIEATLEGKDFVLSGVVPSAALAGSYLRAAEVAYSPYVRSELVVDEQLETVEWLERGPGAIVLLPLIIEGKIVIAEGQVEVSGRSPDEAGIARLEGALGQVTGLPVVVGDVTVANLQPPNYVMAADAGAVTLSGEIPTEDIRDMLVDAAAAAYGPDNVTDQINVNPDVYPSLWMYSGGPLMQAMSTFPDYELRIDGMAFSGFINGGVTFEPGSATFSGNYAQVLDVGVSVLTRDPSLRLVIEGHTDDRGSDEANLALSQRRAEAVRDYFITNGIDPSRLTAVGIGEAEPVVPNDSEEGRARNRRIQYVLSTSA